MKMMKMVVDMPEKLVCEGFERPFTEQEKNSLIKAIGNGTPLPKGHGALVDINKVHLALDEFMYNIDGIHEFLDNEVSPVIEADTEAKWNDT